jgi:hypothetical protein
MQSFVYVLIAAPFIVLAVLVQTPFGEIRLSIPARVACFVFGALMSQVYLDLIGQLEAHTNSKYAI